MVLAGELWSPSVLQPKKDATIEPGETQRQQQQGRRGITRFRGFNLAASLHGTPARIPAIPCTTCNAHEWRWQISGRVKRNIF